MADPDVAFREFPDAATWNTWLDQAADTESEAWLRIGKKGKGAPLVGIEDAGDVALCHGWIDSHRRGFDEVSFLQRYSPRRAGSPWSLVNVRRAERLIDEGRVRERGMREIEAARRDGRWDAAYAPQKDVVVPADFLSALEHNPQAREAFERLSKTDRYALLLPLLKATATNRATRMAGAMTRLS